MGSQNLLRERDQIGVGRAVASRSGKLQLVIHINIIYIAFNFLFFFFMYFENKRRERMLVFFFFKKECWFLNMKERGKIKKRKRKINILMKCFVK